MLFEDPDFIVREVAAASDVCVVTFHSLTDDPRLDRPGFAESFLIDCGVAAIHVINRTNTWYDYETMAHATAIVADAASRYRHVISYGSSMGGYAAIRYAADIGAATAIAISPQYSIEAALVPFERRWRSLGRRQRRRRKSVPHQSSTVQPIVFFDPHDPDRLHAELIARHYPRTSLVSLPHAGHPAGGYLSELDMLKPAIRAIIEGDFDAAAFERQARAARTRAPQYLFTLARRLSATHTHCKMDLVRRALALRDDAAYRIYLSLQLERQGAVAVARDHLEAANRVLPDHPVPLRALCAFWLRQGDPGLARGFAERLVAIGGDTLNAQHLLAATRFLERKHPLGPAAALIAALRSRKQLRRITVRNELRQWDEADFRRHRRSPLHRAIRVFAR